jgi:hypothetical protein
MEAPILTHMQKSRSTAGDANQPQTVQPISTGPEADVKPMAFKGVSILLLESEPEFQKTLMRIVEAEVDKTMGPGRCHFSIAKNEEEARMYQQIGPIHLFIWSGYGVPTRQYKFGYHRERNLKSIEESLTVEDSNSPGMRVIALVPERDTKEKDRIYFSREDSERLGIHRQVLGPEDLYHTGRFRDDLVKAVQAELKQVKLSE